MATNDNEKIMKDAQYRKGLGIGFFNATNSAIALIAALIGNKNNYDWNDDTVIERVGKIRDVFIEQHKDYYAKVIANVGQTYDQKATIEKLQKTQTLEELHTAWISLSEDERRDPEILKVKNLIKKPYENTKKD